MLAKALRHPLAEGHYYSPSFAFAVLLTTVLLVVASALLWTLSIPGSPAPWLAWVALVPALLVLRNCGTGSAFLYGYLWGACYFMMGHAWMAQVSGVHWYDFLAMAVYSGLYLAMFALLYGYLVRTASSLQRVFLAAALWVVMEFAWSHAGVLAMPISGIGYSQYQYPLLLQIAGFTGAYGVSFLVVMVNALLAELIVQRRMLWPAVPVAGGLLGVTLLYGMWALHQPGPAGSLNIAVIQANIPQGLKWKREYYADHLDKHIGLTRAALTSGDAALVIWPESAVPGYPSDLDAPFREVQGLGRELGRYLLVGGSRLPKSADDRKQGLSLNMAYLISPQGTVTGQYAKHRLVPFSEYVPMRESLPWPERFIKNKGSFIPGEELTIFEVDGQRFGTAICWETILSDLVRQFALKGAGFMVNIGNEAWFGDTVAPHQFFAANVFRAVENRMSVARALNSGVSGFIDPYGRILATVREQGKETFVPGYTTAALPIAPERTFYTRHGDIFAYSTVLLVLLYFSCGILSRRRPPGFRAET